MPLRSRRTGFYRDVGRPELTGPLPPDVAAIRRCCGSFFHSAPLTPEEVWLAQAEQRWLTAAAIKNNLPPDAPPELILLASVNDEGELMAWEDYQRAIAAAEAASRQVAKKR